MKTAVKKDIALAAGVAIAVVAGIAGGEYAAKGAAVDMAPKPIAGFTTRTMSYEEEAYLTVARLGMERWMIACAYGIARQGGTQKVAEQKCNSGQRQRLIDSETMREAATKKDPR